MKKHAEICPVCKGSGKYKEYLDYVTTTQAYTEKICHGCHGNGWVEVTDDYSVDTDNCPQGTIVFSDSVTDMNRYYQEFCENRGIKPVEFCDEDNHIPHID